MVIKRHAARCESLKGRRGSSRQARLRRKAAGARKVQKASVQDSRCVSKETARGNETGGVPSRPSASGR